MRAILLLGVLFGSCLFGQEPRWAASFANQGPAVLGGIVGKLGSRGVAVYGATICSGDAAVTLSEAAVLQETNKRGLVIFSAQSLAPLLTRTQARSLPSLLSDAGEGVTLGGAAVVNAGPIKINDATRAKLSFGLVVAAGFFHWLAGKFSGAVLDPSKVGAYILPNSVALGPHQDCWRGDVLGLPYPGGAASFVVQ